MAKLMLKGIEKTYDNVYRAVKDFNLEIEDKEFIVLVGPSGCGKSTTLRMIAGLEEISSGSLYIDDKLVNDIPPKDRDIAMVFQNYALYPHMTVYDNMAFGLKLRKQSKQEIMDRVNAAAEILGIKDLLHRRPRALSGGQRQRVALGRAIVREPKVFLMDEPLSNLDAKLRVQMRAEISKLHQKIQTTFVYVTHDQTEAMTMGSRIVVMKDGIIQQVADPQTIYQNPANAFVASFIGSPQMNFMDCRVIEKDSRLYAQFKEKNLSIAPKKIEILRKHNYQGEEVILGIRPESISIAEDRRDNAIEARVEVVEILGSETYLYLRIDENKLIARVKPDVKVSVGDSVSIYFDTDRIHLFDKETEETIV